jgi:hypothetical protein
MKRRLNNPLRTNYCAEPCGIKFALSIPSFVMIGTIINAANGSDLHQLRNALSSRPVFNSPIRNGKTFGREFSDER